MCGLAGVINAGGFTSIYKDDDFFYKGRGYASSVIVEEDILDQLLYLNTLRGAHSTGIFCADYNEHVLTPATVFKRVIPGTDFIQDPLYKKLRYDFINGKKAIIGHCRHATMGGLTIDAAHPHSADGITLVHNGTLNTWRNLVKTNVVSDSQAITHLLAESDDWAKSLEKLDGAYALVWHNQEDGMIYIARNQERPLWYCNVNGTYAISSEREMLEFALLRTLQLTRTSQIFSNMEIKSFDVGKIYGITPGEEEFSSTTSFTPYEKKVTVYTGGGDSANSNFSSGKNMVPWREQEEKDLKKLEEECGLKKGLDILFTPREFTVYGYQSNHNNVGEIRGRLILADNTESKVIAVKVYCCPDVENFCKMDFVQGTINYISRIYQGDDYLQGFRFRIAIDGGKETDVVGFKYEDEDGELVAKEVLNSKDKRIVLQ